MDPYHTLGVRKGCTREEVKQAFRAKAWHAHPDRGGQNETFIRICTAYKQILADLDWSSSLGTRKPARAPRNGFSSKPPDPCWDPELVVLDEPPRNARPPKPHDPNWEPELVMLDEPPRDARPPKPPAPSVADESYVAGHSRVSAQYARERSVRRSRWVRAVRRTMLLCLIVASIVIWWIAWTLHEPMAARQAATSYEDVE